MSWHAQIRVVVEWNGSNLPPLMTAQSSGCDVYQYRRRRTVPAPIPQWGETQSPDITHGTARTDPVCAMFDNLLKKWKPRESVLITPSDVLPFRSAFTKWTHHMWVPTAMYGDTICGVWGVFTSASFRVESLRQPCGTWAPGTCVEMYARDGHRVPPDESANYIIRRIAHSCAQMLSYTGLDGQRIYSATSQLASPALADLKASCMEWPWPSTRGPPSILLKLAFLGGHAAWFGRVNIRPTEAPDDVWRMSPLSLWTSAIEEIMLRNNRAEQTENSVCFPATEAHQIMGSLLNQGVQRDPADYTVDDEISSEVNNDFSVGGTARRSLVGQTLVDAVGNAQWIDTVSVSLSSLAAGARQVYVRGWKHWVYFCKGYSKEPWIQPGHMGRGEMLIKFTTHEHVVLKLHPSSIRGEIAAIPFHQIMAGAVDFTIQ